MLAMNTEYLAGIPASMTPKFLTNDPAGTSILGKLFTPKLLTSRYALRMIVS